MEGSSSISVAVRIRPFSDKERHLLAASAGIAPVLFQSDSTASSTESSSSSSFPTYSTPQPPRNSAGSTRKILKALDDRILIFDPPENNAVTSFSGKGVFPPTLGKKVKDIRFCFDRVFDEGCGQEEVYEGSAKDLVGHVMNGFHSTVFAYGATGCGKTHTISGSPNQPGIVFLIMKDLFSRIQAKSHDTDFSLTVSYLEIYNETIRDLLDPESGPLALREINGVAAPAGLSTKEPKSANDVVEWIMLGNANRTVNATEANATSSRSHAVLSVSVSQRPRGGGLSENHSSASLSVIDLAGSERASVTKNKGDRLIEGANINRSLLALGNCINALCDPRKRAHVPYRDSKLTRLLKQSLGGNCKTVMIVCVSPSSQHYDETHNTLQYANRAKEIKTKAIRNVVTVDRHVQDYCRLIAELRQQVAEGEASYESRSATSRAMLAETERIEVEGAVRKVRGPWESLYGYSIKGERARVEKAGIEGVVAVLQRWKTTAFQEIDLNSSNPTLQSTRSACESLTSSLSSTARSCTVDSTSSSADTFHTIRNSLASKLASSALATFTLEVRILELQLETAQSVARGEGLLESAKVQARAMSAMCEARARVAIAVESERGNGDAEEERLLQRLADGIDNANREAFLSLSAGSHFAASTSTTTSNANKRDAGTRSPLLLDTSSFSKASRVTVSGYGSSATGSLASPMRQLGIAPTTTFSRRSPRKNVLFQPRTNPILRNSPKKKKGLGVQWRDETGDGWELEDVRSASISPDTSETVIASSPFASTSTPTSITSSYTPSGPSSTAAEMIAASKRTAMAPLGRAQRSVPAPISTDKPFTFLNDDAATTSMPPPPLPRQASRATTSDSSLNSSFSMASTPSGLYAPIVASKPILASPTSERRRTRAVPSTAPRASSSGASRRVSTIGPLRSVKVNRRTSFVPVDLGMMPLSSSTSKRATRGVLTASAAGGELSSSSSLSIGGGVGAGVGSSKPAARGALSSRNSIPPTSTASGFGSKSEARLAARRESTMPSGATTGGLISRESIAGTGKWR